MEILLASVIHIAIAALIWWIYTSMRNSRTEISLQKLKRAVSSGMGEPASLHPIIDESLCIGCRSCIEACPEHEVFGLVDNKATLVNPSKCIGHGRCAPACPTEGITLVFGTEKRGVDIPNLNPNFETNVPGIFIAGELGGMGLIRNAITQGKQAIESISSLEGLGKPNVYDVIIIGAGPAGIAAALSCEEKQLNYLVLEQDSLGGTVFQYPRGKVVMTAPIDLPLAGKQDFLETSKENLLEFWERIVDKYRLKMNFQERMDKIEKSNDGFVITTPKQEYQAKTVLLAIGRRGTPRKMGAEGEELPKVVYRMIDPSQYTGQKILIVGGGDSAVEAACSIGDEEDTTVHISYRAEAFSRIKPGNRDRIENSVKAGKVNLLMKSQVKKVTPYTVELEHDGEMITIDNDVSIVCIGGVLPTPMLKSIGIEIETKFGTA